MKSVTLLWVSLVVCESCMVLDFASMFNGVFSAAESETCGQDVLESGDVLTAIPLNKTNASPGSHIFYMFQRNGTILTANIKVITDNGNGSLDIKSYRIMQPPLNSDGTVDLDAVALLNVSELAYREECNRIHFILQADGVFVGRWPICRGRGAVPTISNVTLTCDNLQFKSADGSMTDYGLVQACGRYPVMMKDGEDFKDGPCSD